MSTIELEAQKASLVREILNIDEQTILNNIRLVLNTGNQIISNKKTLGDFFGVLSEDECQQLKDYTSQARKEWNRTI